jgi:hypothetical protein
MMAAQMTLLEGATRTRVGVARCEESREVYGRKETCHQSLKKGEATTPPRGEPTWEMLNA